MKKTVSVAPMMDCTDKQEVYFLSLISKNIHLYSEMIVANAIIRGDRDKLLSFKKISNPVTLQVGGSNPDELAEACKISEVKKPSLADEALSELKAEQPEIKEENLETEEAPLELSEEAPAQEEIKSE